MPEQATKQQLEFRIAFLANERQERLNTGKVASWLVILLMPVGTVLDYFVYPRDVGYFLILRLLCSALTGGVLFLHTTSIGRKYYKALGLPIALLPAFFITWMIYVTAGPTSPYYAGLNLILLAVSVVVHWSVGESLLAVASVLLMYSVACLLKGTQEHVPIIFSNFYFLLLTGVTVVVGNYFFNRLRFREFSLRFELDQNKKILEDNNQKLRELDQIKNRFFANISHELRTPLTLLLAPLETLLYRFKLEQETSDLLTTMHSNGMRLLKLINDLLDLVRLESGRMEVKREPLDLGDLIRGLASAARQVADDKRLGLETFVDPSLSTILADRDKLEKIVLNLVFNALKFTPAGGRVELRVEKQGDELALTVADTGMGISERHLAHVFDRFWQADDSSKRKYQGVGIGLALVKELVELQDGRVSVASQEGKGTKFTICLPYLGVEASSRPEQAGSQSDSASALAEPSGPRSEEWLANLYRRAELFPALTPVHQALRPVETGVNGNRPRILVADDEPDMLRFLKSQLSSEYQVIEAVDGDQAVEKARQFLPDLLLLDMMMPEKDGLQACCELRQQTLTQSIPIILLTARADEATKLRALQAGASDFLTKPFSSTELHVRIKNLVESYDYQRKLTKQNQVLERTIEQLKETESELVESEKMRSLGQLSAGMIHEINNPLNFAITGLFTLRNNAKLLADGHRAGYLELVDDVEEGVNRVKDLILKMREFSYADNTRVEQVELAQVVASARRFLSHELKDKVRVQEKVPTEHSIWANRNRMTQVLLNVLQNSLDALARKSFPAEEPPTIWIESRVEAERTLLVVRDNGSGIAPEALDKIFDPFFTTKEVGQGMGLGLSISYRIVRDYGGRINVRSEPGKFCEISLEFPAERPPENAGETGSGGQYAGSI